MPHIARSDPIDNAGLFAGPRAGRLTAPVRAPAGAGTTLLTRCADRSLALAILLLEVILVASVWGPQPVGWLWVASQISYLAGSVSLGLLAGFVGMLLSLGLTVAVSARLDHAWKLTRRAAGYAQREGALERLFIAGVVIVVPAFLFWLFVIEGPGSMVFPANPS